MNPVLVKLIDFIAFLGSLVLLPVKFTSAQIKKVDLGPVMKKVRKLFKKKPAKKKKQTKAKKTKWPLKFPRLRLPKLPRIKFRKVKLNVSPVALHFITGVLFAFIFVVFPIQVYGWYRDLPRPELLAEVTNKSTKILDRKGRVLYEIYVDKNYDPVSLSQIPDHMIKATLAVEDDKFYSHHGFRIWSMVRAVRATILGGELQGGSTITQQLVKNVLLTPERTLPRKLKEIVVAVMVEAKYTKDEILEMYLNNIPYGGTAWGTQAASQKFFNKDVWDLNLNEASFLAGLPSAPTSFSPFVGGIEKAKERQVLVLDRMVGLGYISQEQKDDALSQALVLAPQTEYIRAPHFVNYVRAELEKTYGSRMVNGGGLTVTTTLDLDLQEQVQEAVTTGVASSANLQISNGAALVLDTKTGEILAYVGSADYFNDANDGKFDIVTAFRQPGSSIKPLTYSLAFQKGFTPATIVEDEKVTFSNPGAAPYTPVNYDGQFHGRVTIRQALANSYNIPAVKVAAALGADNVVRYGRELGLTGWEPGDGSYGISVTLGGKEVRLLDLTNVYATFSRGGKLKPVTPFLSIKDAKGYETFSADKSEKQTMPEEAAYLISNILSDNNARAAAFGTGSWLNVAGRQVAVKTGTTDLKRDNWTLGYTPSYAVGVWVGNNNNTPMNPFLASGLSGAAPIWNKIMTTVLQNTPPETFQAPANIFVKTDPDCDNKSEVFIRGTAPEHLCDTSEEDED